MRVLPVRAAFGHVIRSTVNNLGIAWHLSWPWMLVILPINIFANLYGFTLDPLKTEPAGQVVAITMLITLVTAFSFASIAVNWHRYILLDEVPQGAARLRADNTVWRYFGNTLLILFVLFIGFVPVTAVSLLGWSMGNAGAVLIVPLYAAAFVFGIAAFYRLSVKLPAVALQRQDFGLKDAWKATEGNTLQLFGLAICFFLAAIAMGAVLGGLLWLLQLTGLAFALLLGLATQIVFNWILTIMGVTLLTSLYGYFAEGRDF
jgi:hypothetical protein